MARPGRKDRGLYQRLNAAGQKEWCVRLVHNKKDRKFGSFGKNKTKAREFYEQAKKEQREGRFFPERYQRGHAPLVETLIDSYLKVSAVKNQAAERNYGMWWKRRLKGLRVDSVTPALLEDAQRGLFAEGKAQQTVLHYMKFLRHLLNRAVRDGQVERNPFDRVTLPKIPKGKTRFLSLAEEARLVAELGPTYGPWARFAIITGLRLSEQMKARWTDVNFDHGFLVLPETKAGEAQFAKLNQEALAILRALPSLGRSIWIFPSENTYTSLDQRNFTTRIFTKAAARAGLEDVTWHTLRHTTASRAAMQGHPDRVLAALLRHKSTALVGRYAHLNPHFLSQVVEDVARFGQPADAALPVRPIPVSSNGTGPETGISQGDAEGEESEVVDKLERAMGFEPTTTSLGS